MELDLEQAAKDFFEDKTVWPLGANRIPRHAVDAFVLWVRRQFEGMAVPKPTGPWKVARIDTSLGPSWRVGKWRAGTTGILESQAEFGSEAEALTVRDALNRLAAAT